MHTDEIFTEKNARKFGWMNPPQNKDRGIWQHKRRVGWSDRKRRPCQIQLSWVSHANTVFALASPIRGCCVLGTRLGQQLGQLWLGYWRVSTSTVPVLFQRVSLWRWCRPFWQLRRIQRSLTGEVSNQSEQISVRSQCNIPPVQTRLYPTAGWLDQCTHRGFHSKQSTGT